MEQGLFNGKLRLHGDPYELSTITNCQLRNTDYRFRLCQDLRTLAGFTITWYRLPLQTLPGPSDSGRSYDHLVPITAFQPPSYTPVSL